LGVPVQIVSCEDLILVKLEWAAQGGSRRQIEDVAGILRIRKDKFDQAYIRKIALQLP
jgi:hypothetical protein